MTTLSDRITDLENVVLNLTTADDEAPVTDPEPRFRVTIKQVIVQDKKVVSGFLGLKLKEVTVDKAVYRATVEDLYNRVTPSHLLYFGGERFDYLREPKRIIEVEGDYVAEVRSQVAEMLVLFRNNELFDQAETRIRNKLVFGGDESVSFTNEEVE
jgi:hypothetical protein